MSDDSRIVNRIVPLAPDLAIRIRPDLTIERGRDDLTFENFVYHIRNIDHVELSKINRLIVQCVEETVFYRDDRPWVQPFVAKNRHYRIEPISQRVPTPDGSYLISTQRIVASAPATTLRPVQDDQRRP